MSNITYAGAKFYKCALQVNPSSYAEYRGEKPQDANTYNQQILEQCQENDIKVVGLANHGDVDGSETLRDYLAQDDIVVFPGFEIASSEKIHMVCLYPETTTHTQLNQFLGLLMGSNSAKLKDVPTHPSSLSCEEIAEKILSQQEGFWYAAHGTGRNGMLRLSGQGDNYIHLWKKESVVVAIQIPGNIEDLDIQQDDLKKYRQIIENTNPDYKRHKPIVVLNAKDVNKPECLNDSSASCLVKMTEPTFDSFRQAFYDPESRIRLNKEISQRPYSVIHSVQWEGSGFFSELAIAFSENLNAIIGGRGTGKSTLIDSIRYALDLPVPEHDRKAIDATRKYAMSTAKISLEVTSKAQQGQKYVISRRFGESPQVKNEQGEMSHLSPREILPDIELLGQNEILTLEKNKDAQLALINRFLPSGEQFNEKMDEIKSRLVSNRVQFIKANEIFDELEGAVNKELVLKEKTKQFEKLGIQKKLKNTNLLASEDAIKRRIDDQFGLIEKWIRDYSEIFDLEFLQDANIEKLPNKENITQVRGIFERLKELLDESNRQVVEQLQQSRADYKNLLPAWNKVSQTIRDELDKAISQLSEHSGKTGNQLAQDYQGIVRQLTSIENKKNEYEKCKKQIIQIKKEREKLLEEYRDTAFRRSNELEISVTTLNDGDLKGKVQISIKRRGNLQALQEFLLDIDGVGQSKIQWLSGDGIELDLVGWASWIGKKNSNEFKTKYHEYGLTSGTIEKLLSMNTEKRLKLEEIELKDVISIELNTNHPGSPLNYVPLENLSTGQKCTAILNLLLLNSDDPLIIDQPEDNLDNSFIVDHLVNDLRRFKTQRQFLFATHNANIPVFGDAELIMVLGNDKNGRRVQNIGSIDKSEVRDQSAEILEGGKAAFNMRKNKYGF